MNEIKVYVHIFLIIVAVIAHIDWTIYEISKPSKDDRLTFIYWAAITFITTYMITVLARG